MKCLSIMFACLLGLSMSMAQNSQELRYQISALNQEIGALDISRTVEGKSIHYRSRSELTINLLLKRVHLVVTNEAHYQSGKLLSANNRVEVNGKLHSSSQTEWRDGCYYVTVDGESVRKVEGPIEVSGSVLYFEEPSGLGAAFSESSGSFLSIQALQPGAYRVRDRINRRKILHRYDEGQLVSVTVEHPLADVDMRLLD